MLLLVFHYIISTTSTLVKSRTIFNAMRKFGKVQYDPLWLSHKVVAQEADGSVKFGELGEGSAYLFDPDTYTDGRISVQGIDGVLFPQEMESKTERKTIPVVKVAPSQGEDQCVIIVGAGTSGLSVAACLTKRSIPFILLEREDCFASLWKKYAYDRLQLHLKKQVCELPHMPFPPSYPQYVPKKQFLEYLDNYVSHFRITPLYNRTVEEAAYDEGAGKWRVRARNGDSGEVEEYSGRAVVVATGESSDPYVPAVEGLGGFKGKVMHSTRFKSGKEFKDEHVLVVGAGNSGMEIALDLANHGAKTSILVRSPIHILSKEILSVGVLLFKYLPLNIVDKVVVIISKVVYGDVTKYGMKRPEEGPFHMKAKYGKYPVIDVGTYHKIKSGEIQVLEGEIESVKGNEVFFKSGKSQPFDSIVFCTGFKRSTQKWLKGDDYLLNEEGLSEHNYPNHWKGKNGLYCVGLARKGFYGAAIDAENIANDISSIM